MRKYVIIDSSEVSGVDFDVVLETSANTLRYSEDGTKTFVKFEGDTSSFLDSKLQYTREEMLLILSEPEWTPEQQD
jgi:uncharacterized protein YllA (UPF0747 family)